MNRARAGTCLVANPFNPRQVSRVSLAPADVDALVFWTRNPGPMMQHLDELDDRGYRYSFLVTLNGYPTELEPHAPRREAAVDAFRRLSDRLGPGRVAWRYDPIVVSTVTPPDFHRASFAAIASALAGRTDRVITSVLDSFRQADSRLAALAAQGIVVEPGQFDEPLLGLLRDLAAMAKGQGMEITSCAEEGAMAGCGIAPGACIDAARLSRLWGVPLPIRQDPGQRKECRCMVSRDIGAYDTCAFGCLYCYATRSPATAAEACRNHDPTAEALLPTR